jgi:hypothetical protein
MDRAPWMNIKEGRLMALRTALMKMSSSPPVYVSEENLMVVRAALLPIITNPLVKVRTDEVILVPDIESMLRFPFTLLQFGRSCQQMLPKQAGQIFKEAQPRFEVAVGAVDSY